MIKRLSNLKKTRKRKVLRGGNNMEMRKEVNNNTYTVVDREKALQAMKNCSKKYEKTLKALAK